MKLKAASSFALVTLTLALQSGTSQAVDPDYTRTTIADRLPGAAFVVAGDVTRSPRNELVVSAFGTLEFGEFGPIIPAAGTVTLFENKDRSNSLKGPISTWDTFEIVTREELITFPNRPTLADIDLDGDQDVIIPGGYFFDSFAGFSRGSLTWWENGNNGRRWTRHDIVTGSSFSYHSAIYEDFNGDNVGDIITVAENGGDPGDPWDDIVELQLFTGTVEHSQGNSLWGGPRTISFNAPQTVALGGGGLIEAYDVDNDGDLDIVSPQFFGLVAGQPFINPHERDERVASFVWFENDGAGAFTTHIIGTEQGPGFAITPVKNLLGDGVTRWIATNHTNPNVEFPPFSLHPEPSVYEFTPGADPRQPWSVRTLSALGDFPVTGGIGQAAPGFAAAGHLNHDGRIDIAVSGDGSRAVYWMEQQNDGTFITHQLPDSDGFGQSGGPVVMDLNRSNTNEIVFGSFDQNAVSIWSRAQGWWSQDGY